MSQGVRLPHLERGLTQALAPVADVVCWARGEQPRDAGESLLSMRLMAPPSVLARHGGRVRARAQSATVTVTGATEGGRNVLQLDGYRHVRDVPAASTVTAERDALKAQLDDIEAGRVTTAAVSTDQITITPVDITALWDLQVSGELTGEVTHGGALRVDKRQEQALVEIQTFARGKHLAQSAHAILTQALNRLVDHDPMVALAEWGVAVLGWSPPVDISAIAGAGWETRASSVLTVNMRARYVAKVKRLETVENDFVLENAS